MTLNLGRVSATVFPWPTQPTVPDTLSRNQSNSFLLRKLPSTYTTYNNSHYVFPHCDQWQCCVSPAFYSFFLNQMTNGCIRYLPVMISRIILSLRKAADPMEKGWSLWEPSTNGISFQSMTSSRTMRDTHQVDDIQLSTYSELKVPHTPA